MATSGILKTTIPSMAGDYLQFEWERTSFSVENNTSTINWTLTFNTTTFGGITTVNDRRYVIGIDKQSYTSYFNFGQVAGNSTFTIASGTTIIPHESNGSKSFDVLAVVQIDVVFSGKEADEGRVEGTVTLDPIPQKAVITQAPNFTDEDSPILKYSNPAGSGVQVLQAGISLNNGANMHIAYRDISKTGDSYTFNFTNEEREYLRNYNKESNTLPLRYYVRTRFSGGSYQISGMSATMTIVNGEPTVSPTVKDTNSNTVAVTGNDQVIVKGMSVVSYDAGAAAVKGATLKSITVQNGDQKKYTATGTFDNPTSGEFLFNAFDSRANTTYATVNLGFINYNKPTLAVEVAQPGADDANASFNFSGTYFVGSFGKVSNTLSVQYRYKKDTGSYNSWSNLSATTNSGKFSGSGAITNLDYQTSYTLQVRVVDKLNIVTKEAQVLVKPVFSWSKDDFEFGVPVAAPSLAVDNLSVTNEIPDLSVGSLTVNGRELSTQKILWSGASHMNGNQTAPLSEKISAQPNGIILVFSLYRNGAAEDVSVQSFFVSKQEAALMGGAPHFYFLGINAGFSIVGAKYIYINDSILLGHIGNTGASTASGITFSNDSFVLRYVIGV